MLPVAELQGGHRDGQEELHAAGRQVHRDRGHQAQGAGDPLQPEPDRGGGDGHPRGAQQQHNQVRPGPEEEHVPEHRPLRGIHPRQGLRRPAAERGEARRAQGRQDKDAGVAGAAVLDVDRGIDTGGAGHVQEDVGEQAGVRGVQAPLPQQNVLKLLTLFELEK